MVQNGGNYDEWGQQLYAPARDLLRTVPWYPTRGNHIKRSNHHILTAEVDAERMVFQALDTSTGKVFDLFMIESN